MESKDIVQFRLVMEHRRDKDVKALIVTLDDLIFGIGKQTVSELLGFFEEDGYKLIRKDRYAGINVKGNVPLFENDKVKMMDGVLRVSFEFSGFVLTNEKDVFKPFVGDYTSETIEVVNQIEVFD